MLNANLERSREDIDANIAVLQERISSLRKDTDAEILVLQNRIRSLQSSRNALSPIYRLPPEVMIQIFMWVQFLYRGNLMETPTPRGAKSLPKWIWITHVSKRWRNSARSSKALYSTIPTHDLGYARKILKASGDHPLSVIVCMDSMRRKDWDSFRVLILSCLRRVRTLWLGAQSEALLLPYLDTVAMDLEELYIWNWENVGRNMLPKSLRYLRLHWCPLKSYEWLFDLSNMVELTLIHYCEDEYVSVDTILNVLDGMPRLISLELSSMFEPPPFTRTDRVHPTAPRLQYLKLTDDLEGILEFLPRLAFAPQFTVDITSHAVAAYNEDVDWSPFFIQLGQHLQASSLVLRTANLIWDGVQPGYAEIFCSEGADKSPCLRIHALLGYSNLLHTSFFKGAEELPFDNLETLTTDAIRDAEDWKHGPWHSLGSLRQLSLQNFQTSSAYFQALVASEAEIQHRLGYTSFASLEELSLHGVSHGYVLKLWIYHVLAQRMKHGAKLRQLVLVDSGLSESSVKQLSEVVDVVKQHGEKRRVRKGKSIA